MHNLCRSRTTVRPRGRLLPTLELLLAPSTSGAGEWTVSSFCKPSIALEYRDRAFSDHGKYDATILRNPVWGRSDARSSISVHLGTVVIPGVHGLRTGVTPRPEPSVKVAW